MKTDCWHTLKVALAAAVLSIACANASAGPSWAMNFNTGCTQLSDAKLNNYGNTWNCSSGAGNPAAGATAWSTTGSGQSFADANLATYAPNGFGVGNRGGVGVGEGLNPTSPDHAMDNNGATDLVMLSFSSSIVVDALTVGWTSNDSDVSLLRYNGTVAPTLGGKTIAALLTDGWDLVGNYANLTANVARTTGAASSKTSSWWLISAYNSGYGGSAVDAVADYVKVLSIAGTTTPTNRTPEPGSLALALLGFGGLWSVQQRQRRRVRQNGLG